MAWFSHVSADSPYLSGVYLRTMRIGILGSGLMGGKLGTIFARAGHEVVFSYARSEQLKRLAREAGGKARAGTPSEAGKVVVTCSLPMNEANTGLVVGTTSSGAEELAKRIPKARVVAAFGTRRWGCGAAPALHQHSQRMGHRRLPRIRQRSKGEGMSRIL
jgi:predicted dinucleotide-binding enzyme